MNYQMTDEMQLALKHIQYGNNVFITGKAGTGKTVFLKQLDGLIKKNMIICSPTGVAAINAGGVTLHSMFLLPFGPISPKSTKNYKFSEAKTQVLVELEILVIDEISMVRADVIDAIDRTLQWIRESDEPFGGVQLVMFGDLYQLPPVVKKEEKTVLKEFYSNFYFFNANVFKRTSFDVVELEKVFRQSDDVFVGILNRIRDYSFTKADLENLNYIRDLEAFEKDDDSIIHLCTHRKDMDNINSKKLGNQGLYRYTAEIEGKFSESAAPCDMTLSLRVGARVMSLVNNASEGIYNGMLGTVVEMSPYYVMVQTDKGHKVKFVPCKWENVEYQVDDKGDIKSVPIGSCKQIPLTLAWAITVHKSQGLTFDKVYLHIAKTFCAGQLYVALSRCRSLDGIVSDSFVKERMIIKDKEIQRFRAQYEENENEFIAL